MDEKPDKETIKLIKSYLKFLGNHIAIEKSILFGSRARGDYFITSDIDLIVVSSDFNIIYEQILEKPDESRGSWIHA